MNFDLTTLGFTIFALVLGLVLHEFVHAYVGLKLGDDTAHSQGRITLNPLAHIDPITTVLLPLVLLLAGLPVFAAAKPVPFNPWALKGGKLGAAAVAAAGPLTNLLISAACGLWMHVVNLSSFGYQLLGTIIAINVGLFVFNMIPLPPLDGSRVLYAIMPRSGRDVMDSLERAGLIVVFGFIFIMSYFPVLSAPLRLIIAGLTNFFLPAQTLPF